MIKEFIVIALVSMLLVPTIAQASCSLGANPLSLNVKGFKGQTVVATWNLYNLYGDRITHIKLTPVNELSGWEIFFEPEVHEAVYNVTGVIQTVDENVALEPRTVVSSIPDPKPEGVDYVKHPNQEGYIPVQPVKIIIKIPEDAEDWKTYDFTIEAVGNCYMEPGAVLPAVASQLKLSVETVSEEYWEKEIKTPETESTGIDITGFVTANASWLGIIVALFALLAYVAFVRKPTTRRQVYSYRQ